MKSFLKGLLVLSLLLMPATVWAEQATSENGVIAEAHGYKVNRFVLTTGIDDREPIDEVMNFPMETQKAFAFIEVGQVEFNTQVTVVWSYKGEEVALVPLMIGASSRWRTYSSKNIGGLVGDWKVELISEAGEILTATEFVVN